MPDDPAEILKDAARLNGLDQTGAVPYHIRVKYETFDEEGDPDQSGMFEEFWKGPRQYKRSYTSDKFTQRDYATAGGLYRVGSQKWPVPDLAKVRANLVTPVSDDIDLSQYRLEKSDVSFGQVRLSCIVPKLRHSDANVIVIGGPKISNGYCFSPVAPILRYGSSDKIYEISFNSIVIFHDRYLAKEVQFSRLGKRRISLHVETIEDLPAQSETEFAAPPDAELIHGRQTLGSGASAEVISRAPMSRPKNGGRGTVHLVIVIGKDGHVIDARALDGPKELQGLAIDLARKWVFRPFLILDEPTELEMEIEMMWS